MISLYFGLPGAGKTTLFASFALMACSAGRKCYGNVGLAIPTYTQIDNECVGKYDLSHCLLLIDEGTLFADCRNYKEFNKRVEQFFVLHRHYDCDILFFSQSWSSLDKRIRELTVNVFYVYKPAIGGKKWTFCYRVPYGIIIPDPKDSSTKLGEIVQGYCKPSKISRLYCKKLYRPAFYQYFDSWEAPALPPLPDRYKEFFPEG